MCIKKIKNIIRELNRICGFEKKKKKMKNSCQIQWLNCVQCKNLNLYIHFDMIQSVLYPLKNINKNISQNSTHIMHALRKQKKIYCSVLKDKLDK